MLKIKPLRRTANGPCTCDFFWGLGSPSSRSSPPAPRWRCRASSLLWGLRGLEVGLVARPGANPPFSLLGPAAVACLPSAHTPGTLAPGLPALPVSLVSYRCNQNKKREKVGARGLGSSSPTRPARVGPLPCSQRLPCPVSCQPGPQADRQHCNLRSALQFTKRVHRLYMPIPKMLASPCRLRDPPRSRSQRAAGSNPGLRAGVLSEAALVSSLSLETQPWRGAKGAGRWRAGSKEGVEERGSGRRGGPAGRGGGAGRVSAGSATAAGEPGSPRRGAHPARDRAGRRGAGAGRAQRSPARQAAPRAPGTGPRSWAPALAEL